MNCLTINTDASFCPTTKSSGYAFYIVCDLFKLQKGGNFKNGSKNPMEAEIMCIGNAIATVLAQKQLPDKIGVIVINSDCLEGMRILGPDGDGKKTASRKLTSGKVRRLVHMLKVKTKCERVEFRHVKAHNGKPDARSYVNDWCDKEAKRWMKLERKNKSSK